MNKQIIWLTGASGVGKTTLLENLKEKYSSKSTWEFLKFDSIGVPSPEDMVKDFGNGENWQKVKTLEWVEKMVKGFEDKETVVMDGQANMNFILDAFKAYDFTNFKIILIDCEQEAMVKRLVDERKQAWLASEDMKNWLKFLRNQSFELKIPVIETTNISKEQVLLEFEKIIS